MVDPAEASAEVAAVAAEIMPGRPPVKAISTAMENDAYSATFGSTPAMMAKAMGLRQFMVRDLRVGVVGKGYGGVEGCAGAVIERAVAEGKLPRAG